MNSVPMNFVPMSFVSKKTFLLVFLLAALVASVAADKKSAPAPKAAAPKAAARPASRPAANRPATGNRPATANRPGAAGTRPGTAAGGRPGVGRPGTGAVNRPGVSGRPGASAGTGRPGGNIGGARGGAGNVSKVNRPLPGKQVSLRGGGTASIRPNGQIRSINRNGMHIEHGLNGSRRIESMHNGARVVTTGRGSGYVQRPYVTRGGRTYVSRTVVINHVAYARVYRSYSYGGYCCYYGYHPAFYYGAAYYGWAYNPWPAPVYWGWGWGGAPWYGFYGGYFAPYPSYPSAAFWLTDYLISAQLQAAYAAQAAANAAAANGAGAAAAGNGGGDQQADNSGGSDQPAASGGAVTLTPEVKALIAEEVKAQLAAEQAQAAQPAVSGGDSGGGQAPAQQASGEVPPALDPARRTFVVDTDLTVASDGQECTLTGGDVITRITDTPDDDRKVTVSVASSKKADCAPGKQVAVAVDDLQEMHNHFQEQLDNGMKEMAAKQGTGGMPKAPDTKTTASDVPPPPPDASAAKTLDDQQAAADQTEAQVSKEAFSQGS